VAECGLGTLERGLWKQNRRRPSATSGSASKSENAPIGSVLKRENGLSGNASKNDSRMINGASKSDSNAAESEPATTVPTISRSVCAPSLASLQRLDRDQGAGRESCGVAGLRRVEVWTWYHDGSCFGGDSLSSRFRTGLRLSRYRNN
jgi:hypothetical protein